MEELIAVTRNIETDWGVIELHKLFPKHVILTESEFKKKVDKYHTDNEGIVSTLNKIIQQINEKVIKFNYLLSSYEGFSSDIDDVHSKKVYYIPSIKNERINYGEKLVSAILFKHKEELYSEIYGWYLEDFNENKYEELYNNFLDLGIIEIEEEGKREINEFITSADEHKRDLMNHLSGRDPLYDFKNSFPGLLYGINADYIVDIINKALQDMIPNFEYKIQKLEFIDSDDSINIRIYEENSLEFTTLSETSSGRQWYFYFKSVSSMLKEGDILLIDEPATNLHLKAQKEVIAELELLSNVVFYTTHSPFMIPLNNDFSVMTIEECKGRKLKYLDSVMYDEITDVFGVSMINQVVIKSFLKWYLIPFKVYNKIKKNYEVDVNYTHVEPSPQTFEYYREFLDGLGTSFIMLLEDKHYLKFKEMFPENKFISMKMINNNNKLLSMAVEECMK